MKALDTLNARAFTRDGEVAVFDKALVSRFEWLRARPQTTCYLACLTHEYPTGHDRGRPAGALQQSPYGS